MGVWTTSVVTGGLVKGVEVGQKHTHAVPEVRGVQLRVVLVLHGVVNPVALPHQVVMSTQNGGVHFGQL